jgi:hypothetical protein
VEDDHQSGVSLCSSPRSSDGDNLKAGPKSGSSFTWQSILVGLNTFKCGYIWRVGDGESIDIRADPWIPSSPNRRILSPRGAAICTKVSELIFPITGSWDEDLLRSLFSVVDVERILQIPLNNQGMGDILSSLDTMFNGSISLVQMHLN